MVKDLWAEKWVDLKKDNLSPVVAYKLSNYGRVKSFVIDKENGQLIKHCLVGGFPAISLKMDNGKRKTTYVHRLVAEHFCAKDSDDHNYVIHVDHDKQNNRAGNLVWVTKEDMVQHQLKSPARVALVNGARSHAKLTEAKVRLLKRKLLDPNRKTRMKILARQFGISEMQLYRIKTGENWGKVEP